MTIPVTETVTMSFDLWSKDTEDDRAVKQLYVLPEIWEPQRRDEDDVEKISDAEFPATIAAVFRRLNDPIGYVLFCAKGEGLFVQHTAFIESERGMTALKCIEGAHRELFLQTPATSLITHTPDWNPGTRALAHKMGGLKLSHVKNFAIRDGRMQGCTIYRMSAFDWACEHHDEFQDVGEAWHEQVQPDAEEDPAQNGWAGLALVMARKQPHKACAIYNAWSVCVEAEKWRLLWSDGRGYAMIDTPSSMWVNGPDRITATIPRCEKTNP